MPSSRRMRVSILIAILTVVVIYYVTTGASSTQNSAFYQRTLAAIREKQTAAQRQDVITEERVRNERVDRLEQEHKIAMKKAAEADDSTDAPLLQKPDPKPLTEQKEKVVVGTSGDSKQQQQQKLMPQPGDGGKVPTGPGAGAASGDKSVAGRKKIPVDGKKIAAADNKVVEGKPPTADGHDGVAKVGNIAPQASNVVKGDNSPHTEEDHLIEVTLNDILKKGPIIIFSKTYCPFSKKAKHILQDLYTINPPPYVVELDEHELGAELQAALEKTTGRRTVPNVLINGKSIGGGDEIENLHTSGKIIETVTSMGGKRIVAAEKKVISASDDGHVPGAPFRA